MNSQILWIKNALHFNPSKSQKNYGAADARNNFDQVNKKSFKSNVRDNTETSNLR